MKIFVKQVSTVFPTNASLLRVITNLQIKHSKVCNIYHVRVHFLPNWHCFWPKKAVFLLKQLQKVQNSQQILIRDKKAYIWAYNFRLSPKFSTGAPCATTQLLPPCPTKHGKILTKFHIQNLSQSDQSLKERLALWPNLGYQICNLSFPTSSLSSTSATVTI